MLLPETYLAALSLMILSMLCWGSWANTLKVCPGYRFQLFYWDYALGLAATTVFWGMTAVITVATIEMMRIGENIHATPHTYATVAPILHKRAPADTADRGTTPNSGAADADGR